jgi:uncharacterized protein (TIGR02117 family)
MAVIIPILFFFLDTSPAINIDSSSSFSSQFYVYLIKQRWHTGLVFEKAKVDTFIWNEINSINDKSFVDVGWGDKDFYQHPGFDAELAFKALFYPTESTLRVEEINIPIKQYAEISDIAVRIELTQNQFNDLCRYVHDTYLRNENDELVIFSEQYNGNIKFYKAKGNYHIFNTCNSWIAKALKHAGFDISENIILAEQLFNEAQEFGTVENVRE